MSDTKHARTRRAAIQRIAWILIAVLGCATSFACEAAPVPKKRSVPERVLILMHGRGAAADDLQPLADQLAKAAPKVKFILPAGPHPFGNGRAWYPRLGDATPPAVDQRMLLARVQARNIVMDLVKELRTQGVPDERIYVGGFSQGATVALDVILSEEGAKLGGLVSLSGGVLAFDLSPLQLRAKLRAFVSHGTTDPVLDFVTSKHLADTLQSDHHAVRFVEFDGGHTIPTAVRLALGEFLAAD